MGRRRNTNLPSMSLLIIQILLFLAGFSPDTALADAPSNSIRFQLIHRHGSELLGRVVSPRTRFQRVQELVRSDNLRSNTVSQMLNRRRRATEVPDNATSFALPISSGAYSGTGQYFVRFRVGTPAQRFLLVADTGSDLTWMNCRYRCPRCENPNPGLHGRRRRIFNADNSSTFHPIRCSSPMCKSQLPFSLTTCPTPGSSTITQPKRLRTALMGIITPTYSPKYPSPGSSKPGFLFFRYADGSTAQGFFANESATITLKTGQKAKFKHIVIGCTSAFSGSSFREADGVLGLGHSRYSFATKVTAKFGGKFSYCLVDHLSPKNVSSYLTFGSTPASAACLQPTFRYAKLVVDPKLEPFYAVEVVGVSVGSALLKIPRAVWDLSRDGGVIIDSGTSLTMLAQPAYVVVMAALTKALRGLPRVDLKPFGFCFNSTGGYEEAMVPRLGIHLRETARFEPPVKSYVIDVAVGVKCVGFLPAPWPGVSTIGNILQQNYLWEFDIQNGRLGFQPSTCE